MTKTFSSHMQLIWNAGEGNKHISSHTFTCYARRATRWWWSMHKMPAKPCMNAIICCFVTYKSHNDTCHLFVHVSFTAWTQFYWFWASLLTKASALLIPTHWNTPTLSVAAHAWQEKGDIFWKHITKTQTIRILSYKSTFWVVVLEMNKGTKEKVDDEKE